MKKNYIFLLLAFMLFPSVYLKAQVITYPVPAESITRGLDSTMLTVHIVFPSCAGPLVTVNLGASNIPGIIEYIPGSLTQITANSSAGITISESNISDLQNPVFAVSTTTVGQFVEFTIKRRSNCGEAAASKDNIVVSGGCSFSETDINVNTYNLLAPALTLVPPATLSNVDVGSTNNRTITVTNGGNGCLDTMGFWISYPSNSLTLNSLQIGATTLTPLFQNSDSAYFLVFGSAIGGDNLLCNGESLVFLENVTVLKCNATTTYGADWMAHKDNIICESQTTTSGMTMSNNLPYITISMQPIDNNWCPDGSYIVRTLRVVNTGSGPATNLKTTYFGHSLGAFYYSSTDTSNWVVKDKLGNILGTMSRVVGSPMPTLYQAQAIYGTLCNNGPLGQYNDNVQMTLPTLVIPAGDTVYIDYRVYHDNVICPGCRSDYYGWENNDFAYSYQDQCGSGSNSSPRVGLYGTGYPRSQYQVQVDPDIKANKPFTYRINYASLISIVSPVNGRSYIFVKLPQDISINGPIASTLNSGGYASTLDYFQSNDTLFIDMHENTSAAGSVTIPLIANCGTGGTKQFQMGHFHWWDSVNCANNVLTLACQNNATVLHCPGCNTGGATPTDFQLTRINYGYADNDNDNLADVSGSINLPNLNLKNTLNGDTVLGVWNINVYANGTAGDPNIGVPFNHLYIDFPLTELPPGEVSNGFWQFPYRYNPVPNAVATIYPNGGGASFTCTISPTIINHIAHYDFSSCKATWNGGDSLVVEAKYVVAGQAGSGGYYNAFTNVEVYSTYLPQATPATAPIALSTYTCDHFQNYVDILNSYTSVYAYPVYLNGCINRNISYGVEYSIIDNGAAIKFPYEARVISLPDTVVMRIPNGFVYEPNSATLNSGYSSPGSNLLAPSNVIVSGNYVKAVNLKSLFKEYGGAIDAYAEYFSYNVTIRVMPTCESVIGLTGTVSHDISTAGNGLNTPSSYHSYLPWGGHHPGDSSGTIVNVNYNAPQPIMTGGGAVTSTDGTATWNVVLQNLSNSLAADNSWFYFTPVNGITNIVVAEGATTYLPNANGFYEIGNLAPGANRNFTITAKTTNCAADSMRINEGFDCVAYPTSFSLQSCTKTAWLKIVNYPSQVQLTLTKQPIVLPATEIDLCTSTTAEFVINSAQAAFADNPEFRVIPPVGLNISMGEIEYPLGSNNWQVITPNIAAGVYVYSVENHTQVTTLWGTKGLPGTINYAGTDQRQAKLRLTFTTDCNFVSGAKLAVQERAYRPCGLPIPNNLGFNAIVRTNPINITMPVPVTGIGSFNLNLTPNVVSCNTSLYNGSVTPVATSTQVGDTLLITLPEGVAYDGNFTSNSGATLVPGYPMPAPGNGQFLKIELPTGITSGTPINYSFNLTPTATLGACGDFDILSEYIRTTAPLMCGLTTCPTGTKIVLGSDIQVITINKPDFVISSLTANVYNSFAPYSYGITATITNNSTENSTNYILVYAYDTDNDGIISNADVILDTIVNNDGVLANTSEVITHNFTTNSASGGSQLIVGILATNGVNMTCACNNAFARVPITLIATASLGDKVWNDLDNNGVQDAGEVGVAGITVTLYDINNTIIGTTVTDAYGNYLFANLPTGDYKVGFTLPQNYEFSPSSGTNEVDATNSDVNPTTGLTSTVTLSTGENQLNIDAGIHFSQPTTASIGNYVWNDLDADGIQDAGEVGVSGVTVTLYDGSGSPVATTITDANGFYEFTNVVPGTYTVGFTPPVGYVNSPNNGGVSNPSNSDANPLTGQTAPFAVNAGDNITYVDAGFTPQNAANASLGDKVWNDLNQDGIQDAGEPGVAGVTVTLYGSDGVTVIATTTTDAFGNYVFNNLTPSTYVVGFSTPSGYTLTVPGAGSDTTLNSDAVIVTGKTAPIVLASGQNNMTIDAGIYNTNPANTNSIGDKVWNDLDEDGIQDANEPGIAGVTVTLYDNTNTIIGITSTDANGNYLFPNLPNGTYTVGFSNLPNGFMFTQTGQGTFSTDSDPNPSTGLTSPITLSGNTNVNDVDAGLVQGNIRIGTATLGDQVWYDLDGDGIQDAGEGGVAVVTVTLYGPDGTTVLASTITDALGNYIFTGLDAGSYIVGLSNLPAGFTVSPENADAQGINGENNSDVNTISLKTTIIILSEGEDQMSVDMGIVPPVGTASLGNFVWYDLDGDGIQDSNEPGMQGITVTLYDDPGNIVGTTTTDANGQYQFVGLAPGTYSVGFTNLPNGFSFAPQNTDATGINGTTNSDANPTSGLTGTVTLIAGENNTNIDAGIITTTKASLGDYVWNDINGNGIQDPNEPGVAGILVTLYDNLGNPISSTITGPIGEYLFANLDTGTYSLGFSNLPNGMIFTTQETDPNSTTGSNVNPSTGITLPIVLNAGGYNPSIDAGLTTPSSVGLGNYVWYDVDKDGVQDSNEPGIAGAIVTLYAQDGTTVLGSAITDGNGAYTFTNLPAGQYSICVGNVPYIYHSTGNRMIAVPTTQNAGAGTDETDSDINPAGGCTINYSLAAGEYNPTLDAGFIYQFAVPIVMKDFTVLNDQCNVFVNWTTSSEKNTSHYNVMRTSTQNNITTPIAQIPAKGNTQDETSYSYSDREVTTDSYTYQLEIVDVDLNTTKSDKASVQVNCATNNDKVVVYPNPSTGQINVRIVSEQTDDYTINVRDAVGRLVMQTTVDVNNTTKNIILNLEGLSSGTYSVEVLGSYQSQTYKLHLSK